jgi:hypothetical protein
MNMPQLILQELLVFVDNEQQVDPRLLFKWKRLLPARFTGINDEQDEKIALDNQVINCWGRLSKV